MTSRNPHVTDNTDKRTINADIDSNYRKPITVRIIMSNLQFSTGPASNFQAKADNQIKTFPQIVVLVVDDDESFRRAFVDSLVDLTNIDVVPEESETGEEALARLNGEVFDVVFLDLNLPGLNGLTTYDQINNSGIDTQVVLMTSEPASAVARDASERNLEVHNKLELRQKLREILLS